MVKTKTLQKIGLVRTQKTPTIDPNATKSTKVQYHMTTQSHNIQFVEIDGVQIPFMVRQVADFELNLEFYVPTSDMQQRHNRRFHDNHIRSEWYQKKYLKSIGIGHFFHQAGYHIYTEWDNSTDRIHQTGEFDDRFDVYQLPGYNRVELFGNDISVEKAPLFLKAYLQKADDPFA